MISDEEMPRTKSNFRELLKFFESNSKKNESSKTPPTTRVLLPSSTVLVVSSSRPASNQNYSTENEINGNTDATSVRRASADILLEERHEQHKTTAEHNFNFQSAKDFFESRASLDSKASVTSPGSNSVFEAPTKKEKPIPPKRKNPPSQKLPVSSTDYSADESDDSTNLGKKLSRGIPLCFSSKHTFNQKKSSLDGEEVSQNGARHDSDSTPSNSTENLHCESDPPDTTASTIFTVIQRVDSSDDNIFSNDDKSHQTTDNKQSADSHCEPEVERSKTRSFTDRLSIKRSSRKSDRRSEKLKENEPEEDDSTGEVLLRDKLKSEEQCYDRRGKYQSVIFKDPAPLYQIYDKSAKRRDSIKALQIDVRSRDGQPSLSEEDDQFECQSSGDNLNSLETPRSSKVVDDSRISQISTNFQKFAAQGPNKLIWEEMEEIKEKNLSANLTHKEKSLQNSLFEVITSEASYYHSLSVLINSFYKSEAFDCSKPETSVVTALEKHHLFSNILEIHAKSEKFLKDLEDSWLKDAMLKDLPHIIYEHGENNFGVYITYVKNQPFQIKTFEKLMDNQRFCDALKEIRRSPETSFMDLHSFLLMPFQRVTRIRLLLLNTLHNCKEESKIYYDALLGLAVFDGILEQCQSQTLLMSQKERIAHLSNNLEYKSHVKTVSIGDKILKEGELRVQEIGRAASTAFKAKFFNSKPMATLFLSHEFLLITRKKSNGRYSVEDVCSQKSVELDRPPLPEDAIPSAKKRENLPPNVINGGHSDEDPLPPIHSNTQINNFEAVWPFRMTAEGSKGKVVYVFVAKSISERERWMDALKPNFRCGDLKNFESPDCMQVFVNKPHPATECDELNLKVSDLVNILIALPDGWYKGILPGRRTGWFPSKDTIIVEDEEVRRQNMEKFHLGEKAQLAYEEQKKKRKSMIFMDDDDSQ